MNQVKNNSLSNFAFEALKQRNALAVDHAKQEQLKPVINFDDPGPVADFSGASFEVSTSPVPSQKVKTTEALLKEQLETKGFTYWDDATFAAFDSATNKDAFLEEMKLPPEAGLLTDIYSDKELESLTSFFQQGGTWSNLEEMVELEGYENLLQAVRSEL